MRCINMLNLAGQLKAGRGLAIVVAFVKGSTSNAADRSKAEEVLISQRQISHYFPSMLLLLSLLSYYFQYDAVKLSPIQ